MAVVWIGSIRHARMPQAVRYVANPVKTAYSHKKGEDAAMTANIAYALNPEKGTARLFQTALHLKSVESAWTEMRARAFTSYRASNRGRSHPNWRTGSA